MKRIIWICLLLLIVPALSPAAVIGPARIRMVDGDVMFRTPDSEEWLPAAVNTPLDEGDALWCPENARVEIQLADGSMVRLDEGSQLDLLANEDQFTHLHLASGRAYVRTDKAATDNSLQIDADDTTVLPAARTRLRIDILPDNQEDVSIFKGSAYVEGNGSRTRVRAGEHIALEEGHNELLSLNPPDSWEDWNMERDREQSRAARAESPLPEELRGYSGELDSNGSWVRVPEYGMVWRPTVIISNDWAPYRSGRWIWKGSDYVWISSENWGWIPYHYGRWAVVSGFGWCWVPPARGDVYWGPGYVGWYRTGNHVGWTPLAPGEQFYGRKHYGRHSVNVTTTTVNTGNIAYRNRNVRGGMTVVPQNDFLRGRIVSQSASGNASLSISVSAGSPRIQPLRETRMPIVKQTPPRVAPPRTEYRDNRELRQRFPRLTPEADARHRPQQTPPAATNDKNRGIKVRQPATTPVDQRPPATVQPRSVPQQRPEQRRLPPQKDGHPAPPVSGVAPRQTEQPRPAPTATSGGSPQVVTPPRTERRQGVKAPPPATTQPAPAAQRVEQPRPESQRSGLKEKKVWRVVAPDDSREQNQKEKGLKERERRER